MRIAAIAAMLLLGFGSLRCAILYAATVKSDLQDYDWEVNNRDYGGEFITLDYKQAEDDTINQVLSFMCEKKAHYFKIMIFPPNEIYKNNKENIPVMIGRFPKLSPDNTFLQNWSNGYKYIFQYDEAKVREVIEYFQFNETHGATYVTFIYSGEFNGKTDTLVKSPVEINGFSDAFAKFEQQCLELRSKH